MGQEQDRVFVTFKLNWLAILYPKSEAPILGIDNHNEYYDPKIKEARSQRLLKYPNYQHFRIDLKDGENLNKLFKVHNPNMVVNLAAQAGVRLPVDKYKNYISSNIDGFLNVMNFALLRGCKKVIYASSSSVYGDAKIPFSEKDNGDELIAYKLRDCKS